MEIHRQSTKELDAHVIKSKVSTGRRALGRRGMFSSSFMNQKESVRLMAAEQTVYLSKQSRAFILNDG